VQNRLFKQQYKELFVEYEIKQQKMTLEETKENNALLLVNHCFFTEWQQETSHDLHHDTQSVETPKE